MVDVMRLVMRTGGALHLRVYRASGGRLMGRTSGMPVLLLTVAGRTTGHPAHHTAGLPRQWRPLRRHRVGGRIAGRAAVVPQPAQGRPGRRRGGPAADPGHGGDRPTPGTSAAVGAADRAVTRIRPLPGQGGAGHPDGDPHPRPRRERPAGLSLVTSRVGPYGGLTGRPRWVGPAMHELAIAQSVVDAVLERTGERRVAGGPSARRPALRCRPRRAAVLLRPRHRRDPARGRSARHRGTPGARLPALRHDFALDDLILLCPCGSADVEVLCGRELRSVRSVEVALTMCTTCGCGEDDVRVTRVGCSSHQHGRRSTAIGTPQPRGSPHPPTVRTHTVAARGTPSWRRTTTSPPQPGWLAERRHHRRQPDELAGLGQDHPAGAHHPRAARRGRIAVIEGDQETVLDAERIRARRRPCGAGQHRRRLPPRRGHGAPGAGALRPEPGSSLFIENVGNLVCPALFDLGETARVVVISVTEGDDKPLKYPHMFAAADLVVVNKTDLLPYVDFDLDRLRRYARRLNPDVEVLPSRRRTGTRPRAAGTTGCRHAVVRGDTGRSAARLDTPVGQVSIRRRGRASGPHAPAPATRQGLPPQAPESGGTMPTAEAAVKPNRRSSTCCGSTPDSAVTATPSP